MPPQMMTRVPQASRAPFEGGADHRLGGEALGKVVARLLDQLEQKVRVVVGVQHQRLPLGVHDLRELLHEGQDNLPVQRRRGNLRVEVAAVADEPGGRVGRRRPRPLLLHLRHHAQKVLDLPRVIGHLQEAVLVAGEVLQEVVRRERRRR